MWANPYGGGWPIQQADYQHMPHDQVDWAELAKQWISQKENVSGSTPTGTCDFPPPPLDALSTTPRPPPPPPPPPPPIESERSPAPMKVEDENSMDIASDGEEEPRNTNTVSPVESNIAPQQLPAGPDLWMQQQQQWWPGGEDTGWMGHQSGMANKNGQIGEDSFPPMMGYGGPDSSQVYFNQVMASTGLPQFPPGGGGLLIQDDAEESKEFHPYFQDQSTGKDDRPQQPLLGRKPSHHHGRHQHHVHQDPPHFHSRMPNDFTPGHPGPQSDPGLDAAKRRNLPAWIREGLEKMEREKQRQAEKEQLKQQREEMLKKQEKELLNTKEEEDGSDDGQPKVPRKSRFDSDDEDEGMNDDVNDKRSLSTSPSRSQQSPSKSPVKAQSPSPDEYMTEEEKEMALMMKVKRLLTETLLDVTDSEMLLIATEVYEKAKKKALKAPAKQLAKSSALASLSSLGLGYGSGSEESNENNDSAKEEEDDSESDSELEEKIRRKKEAFAKRHGVETDTGDAQESFQATDSHRSRDERGLSGPDKFVLVEENRQKDTKSSDKKTSKDSNKKLNKELDTKEKHKSRWDDKLSLNKKVEASQKDNAKPETHKKRLSEEEKVNSSENEIKTEGQKLLKHRSSSSSSGGSSTSSDSSSDSGSGSSSDSNDEGESGSSSSSTSSSSSSTESQSEVKKKKDIIENCEVKVAGMKKSSNQSKDHGDEERREHKIRKGYSEKSEKTYDNEDKIKGKKVVYRQDKRSVNKDLGKPNHNASTLKEAYIEDTSDADSSQGGRSRERKSSKDKKKKKWSPNSQEEEDRDDDIRSDSKERYRISRSRQQKEAKCRSRSLSEEKETKRHNKKDANRKLRHRCRDSLESDEGKKKSHRSRSTSEEDRESHSAHETDIEVEDHYQHRIRRREVGWKKKDNRYSKSSERSVSIDRDRSKSGKPSRLVERYSGRKSKKRQKRSWSRSSGDNRSSQRAERKESPHHKKARVKHRRRSQDEYGDGVRGKDAYRDDVHERGKTSSKNKRHGRARSRSTSRRW